MVKYFKRYNGRFGFIDKAAWTKKTLHTFCDLCIKVIDMGKRPNTHFDKMGWKFLMTSFKE